MGRMRHQSLVFLASIALTAGRDGDPVSPTPAIPRVDASWLTGSALTALDRGTGTFVLDLPATPTVPLARAESLAVLAARWVGHPSNFGNAAAVLQWVDRGGPIDFMNLKPCMRRTYVHDGYAEAPENAPSWLRRMTGPYWAIPLCAERPEVQLSAGIADNVLETRIIGGELVLPAQGGQLDWSLTGVPHRFPTGLPLGPEEAVRHVYQATARRIDRVPVAFDQLSDEGFGQFPLCASWRVHIEGPVWVWNDATGAMELRDEFYVKRAPACFSDEVAMFVPAAVQPATRWFRTSFEGRDSVEVRIEGRVLFQRVRD